MLYHITYVTRTNREAALSVKGIEQVEEACLQLKEQGIVPTIVRYSLAAASTDTADIVGKELKVRTTIFSCLY